MKYQKGDILTALCSTVKEYPLSYDWGFFCQYGGEGIVFSGADTYETAFFEAFPRKPKCFIRGEGKTVEDAEKEAWGKYQKIIICDHEMERRGRTDGYGYCKKCSYSSTVFEALTKCYKCGIPTSYTEDTRGNHFCKKHRRFIPKKYIHKSILRGRGKKTSRKLKKNFKKSFLVNMRKKDIYLKVKDLEYREGSFGPSIQGGGWRSAPLGRRSLKRYINKHLYGIDNNHLS